MRYELADSVYCCAASGTLIFLDLKKNRYFRLSPDAERSVTALASADACQDDGDDRLKHLVERGVLREVSADRPLTRDIFTRFQMPNAELRGCPRGASLPVVASAVLARARAKLELRLWPLQILGHLPSTSQAGCHRLQGRPGHRGVHDIVNAFSATDWIMSSAERCLELSIALSRALRGRGYAARVVLGVATRPFAAHCWVQIGGTLIADRLERIRPFTPIAVL